MGSLNKVILMGLMAETPELKTTRSGIKTTSFVIAVEKDYSGEDEPENDLITITCFRQLAENVCRLMNAGTAIVVEGKIQSRSWTDKLGKQRYSLDIIASEVTFTPRRQKTTVQKQHITDSPPENASNITFADLKDDDNDLPL